MENRNLDITEKNLTQKTLSGVFWKFAERVLAEVVALVVSIVLARILLPSDYSIVSIVTIFIAFANVIISSGLNTALIQKKDSDSDDYNTVLIISTLISVVLYFLLFCTAPLIASIYDKQLLIPVIRVMGLVLIVNAVKSILCAYVSNRMEFKKFFWSTFVGTALSGIIGIVMAFNGFGVWSLVAQYLINATVDTLILFITTRFKITFRFSSKNLKRLWGFGWKVLVTEIISVTYDNISPLVIGVKFSPDALAYYTKGRSFPNTANSTITNTLSSVLFPAMSKIQNNKPQLLNYTRKFIKIASYCISPLMLGFLAVSDNFVQVVLTEKWLPASIYIKIFCVSYMLNIITTGNLQVIRASGRSDILLVLEIIKKSSYLVVLAIFVFLSPSPEIMAISSIVINIMAMGINGFPNRKLIGYGFRMQLIDVLPNMAIAGIMAFVVYLMRNICINTSLLLIIQITAGIIVYLMLSFIFKPQGFRILLKYAKGKIKGGKAGE